MVLVESEGGQTVAVGARRGRAVKRERVESMTGRSGFRAGERTRYIMRGRRGVMIIS